MVYRFKCVLFDFDGVIGQTMDDNYQAWSFAFGNHGVTFSEQEYFLLEGSTPSEIARKFLPKELSSRVEIVNQLRSSKEDYYLKNNKFKAYEGAFELLSQLKGRDFKLGLVTGGARERLLSTLPPSISRFFDVIITAEDVTLGKPSPEGYLKAATKIGFNPESCLVIENAPLGIDAAKSAGMFCIGICSTLAPIYLTKADVTLARVSEVETWLEANVH